MQSGAILGDVDRFAGKHLVARGGNTCRVREGEEQAARLLVAAYLMRGRRFGAAEALAWARMAHPMAAAGPAPGLVLLPGGGPRTSP